VRAGYGEIGNSSGRVEGLAENGRVEGVALDEKRGAAWEEGAPVNARYGRGAKWYAGVVAKVHADGTFDIDYNDGDREERVSSGMIRSREVVTMS
jgi:hypothetical protein